MGWKRGTPQEVFVLADAGPLGYLSIAAHGHADALAFVLSAGGKPILVDPGTYAYHTDPAWRSYFRSTPAHNTVTVDGQDQSAQGGPFLWTHKARAAVHSWEARDTGAKLAASHDGYARFGVTHERSLELCENVLTIVDQLKGSGEHTVALHFHCAPECTVEQLSPHTLTLKRDGVRVQMTLPDTLEVALVRGGEKAGWYSPVFTVKQETTSITATTHASLPLSITTALEVHCES